MMNLDITDWFMMGFTAVLLLAGTTYIFIHPSPTVYGIWAGILTAQGGLFHGLRVWDQKAKDAT
jgi:hypothetical protein